MGRCFVIQPFDGGVFDKRYEDTFRPAIERAGLEPYRVDQDPSVLVPIVEIEKGILDSDICFAEISTDNPNVWFELGYAIASKKPVIMVCTNDRPKFPFDLQHRTVIRYKSEAKSDFDELGNTITSRLRAAIERDVDLEELVGRSPVKRTYDLADHEVAVLVVAASYKASQEEPPSLSNVRHDMNRAGFTDIAVSLAVRGLTRRSLLFEKAVEGYGRDSYTALMPTEAGLSWLDENIDRVVLHRESEADGLPF